MATEMKMFDGLPTEKTRGRNLLGLEGFGLDIATVYGYDPLTGAVTYTNNDLASGADLIVGYIFGEQQEDGSFKSYTFTADSTTFIWGTFYEDTAPDKDNSKTTDVLTYALNPSEEITPDAFVFVGEVKTLGTASVDWGSGSRTLGINAQDLIGYVGYMYDNSIIVDVVTVKPWAPEAEVTGFEISKG